MLRSFVNRATGTVPLQLTGAGRPTDVDVRGCKERWSAVELSRQTWATSTLGERRTVSSTLEGQQSLFPIDLCSLVNSNTPNHDIVIIIIVSCSSCSTNITITVCLQHVTFRRYYVRLKCPLKSHLLISCGTLWLFCFQAPCINSLTYLLAYLSPASTSLSELPTCEILDHLSVMA